jgi:ACT domain-containing protein
MAKVKQLTVSLKNRPGALAQLAQTLADAKVNVVALLGSSAGTQGTAQVVVEQISKAKKEAGEEGHQHRIRLCHHAQRRKESSASGCHFSEEHWIVAQRLLAMRSRLNLL